MFYAEMETNKKTEIVLPLLPFFGGEKGIGHIKSKLSCLFPYYRYRKQLTL